MFVPPPQYFHWRGGGATSPLPPQDRRLCMGVGLGLGVGVQSYHCCVI